VREREKKRERGGERESKRERERERKHARERERHSEPKIVEHRLERERVCV